MTTIRGAILPQNISNVVLEDVPCDATVYVGAAVRMTGAGIAVNALADSTANANVIGLVQSKSGSELCTIRVLGVSPDIFSGLDVSKQYFLSPTIAGGIQDSPPVGSGEVMVPLGQPFSSTELYIYRKESVVRS